ncbi:DUF1819 family protein [Achromobacter sp. MFA1 R4]|uniref:DUF1819 family protein n=1 Tax=Achromobacter sp. MFA1 R4 TaxID=1881016 RepID=UPI0009539786|nr:DUF1819 family protein [Achromobacter sp. MFA1 R4]SIT20058.1 Putative inner membrane protein [Achromobacter sp. MFA1 R4]
MAERYRLSFTTGGLFLLEAPAIAEHYLTTQDWEQTRSHVRSGNVLQVRTAAASTRISKELIARLELLDFEELEVLIDSNLRDRAYLLWVAACRRYAFVRDFAREVLRENFLVLRRQLSAADYEAFVSAKALWHDELDELAPSTQRKLRQNLFRMLREAELLSEQLLIQPTVLTPQLALLLARRGVDELLVFPASDQEIKRWLK